MKTSILWISDFNINNNPGGSQRTDEEVIQEGLRQGYRITRFNLEDSDELLTAQYDIVVSGNLEQMKAKRPHVFDYIIQAPNHVRFEHDANSYLSQVDRQALFGSSILNCFLSKYHYSTFVELYGEIFPNPKIITSPINTDVFKVVKKQDEREDATLYIGFMHFLKGTHSFFNHVLKHPKEKFVMAAWGAKSLERTARRFPNVEWLGTVPYVDMPELFNNYKRMYYHPAKFEPFCRSVGEALLCGIEVDGSDNIGALRDYHEVGLDGLRELCSHSKTEFWNQVEGNVK